MTGYVNTISASTRPEPTSAVAPAKFAPSKAEQMRDTSAAVGEKNPASSTQVTEALKKINHSLQQASIGVRFEFDKEAQTLITKVVDAESGELIRQMPSEEMVRISNALGKLQGLLVSQKA